MSQYEERSLDSDVLKERHEYSIDLDNNIIYLEGDLEADEEVASSISWYTASRFRKNMNTLTGSFDADESDNKTITVEINSIGGDVPAGLLICDSITTCKYPIKALVTGEASSMACVILQAFKERLLMPNARVMYHPGDTVVGSAHPEWEAAIKNERFINKKADDIVFNRMKEKNPKLTRTKFNKMVTKGIYVNAEDAIKLGLADRII